MPKPRELLCYVHESWRPRIEPAPRERDWMDATPERFAYRSLPLAVANAHGWVLRSPHGLWARWSGGTGVDAVEIRSDPGTPHEAAVSIFGQGVLSFHVPGLFRTPLGINLWVSGPPNAMIDGISPLTGLIETDWSPYSFTMNWQFTRTDHWVRFDRGQSFCFIMPVQRGLVESLDPRIAPLSDGPELATDFAEWDRSRRAFQERVEREPPQTPSEKWQKLYYRGLRPNGDEAQPDHQTKIRAKPFGNTHS